MNPAGKVRCNMWTKVPATLATASKQSQANPWARGSSVAPAISPAGMADGGSGDANTSNTGPTWAASEANLRDHAVRLKKRRGC